MTDLATKTCTRCGETKTLDEFHRNKYRKDGRHSACKPCAIETQNASRGKPPKLDRQKWAPAGMKVCAHCGKTRKLESFPNYRHSYDGKFHSCKECMKKHQPKYVPGQHREQNRKRYWRDPEAARDRRISAHHGVPRGTYAKLLEIQGGCCAICQRTENAGKMRFAFDHSHSTKMVRGLLCTLCNQAIGQLGDSPELLRKAIAYLENPPASHLALTSRFVRKAREKPSA